MATKIRTAILAYGMSGQIFHAPFLSAHDGFELTGVLERSHQNAPKDYPGVRVYRSLEEVINDTEIELVVVNTPNFLHFEHTKAALAAGKHVLVEKPVCTTPEELEALFALADQHKRQLLFYQNRRWDSDFQSLKRVLQLGKLGRIHEAHFRFDRYNLNLSHKTFKERPIDASGIQYDLIPHVLDQALAIFGMPEKVYKRLSILRPESKVNDFCSLQLSYSDHLEVYVVASLVTAKLPPAFRVYGQNGCFEQMRSDVQEDQLKAGIRPGDANYGLPQGAGGGLLTLRTAEKVTSQVVKEQKGDYMGLFDAVFKSIRDGAAYPVTREQITQQIRLLALTP